MEQEPETEVAAIDRDLSVDGTRTVATISRSYDTDVEDLWEACTTADRLARWFAPVSGALELGGRYQIEGNAGGTVTRCDKPDAFRVTWEFGDQVSDLVVTFTADGPDRSRLTLTHSADVDPEFWERYGPGATGVGWDLALAGLAGHVSTGRDVRQEGLEWAASEAGRRFMTASSTAWADRSIAAGTPQDAARAAEARTTAFYLGG